MNCAQSSRDDALSPDQFIEINRICDRFEAACRAGRCPAIEDYLGEAAEPVRSELLRELLATELERRWSAGEHPCVAEYQARFPASSALVEAAFGWAGSPHEAPIAAPSPDASDTGRNLLFGLLALQNSFIDRDALVAAFGTWVSDKSKSLGDILLARGMLDSQRHTLLEALVAEHLTLHRGDPERSLAAIAVGGSTRESLERIGDPGLDDSLSHAGLATVTGGQDSASPCALEPSSAQRRRFRVLRPHAQGGLGAVFVALDSELNREVALKEILDRHADNLANRARFLMEAEITGRLEHPGIVPVYGLGTYADGRPYYAMRFIRGESLKEAIAAFHAGSELEPDPGQRSLELRKLLRRFLDVCNAIDYAHSRGVLHRDIKPGNVIVGKHGETLVVDWGLAKPTGVREPSLLSDERTLWPSSASGSAETLPGSALGTPAYMSPEQATGDIDRLGPRSDVYSLGATLYSLLTGCPPFDSASVDEILHRVTKGAFAPPRRVAPTIDRALEAICLKAMALQPEDRYATPRALADDLERWIADEPVFAWHEPLWRRSRRWARRHRTLVVSTVAVLLFGLAGLAGFATVVTSKNRELDRQWRLAQAERDRAAAAERTARAEAARSRKSETETKTVLEFFQEKVLAAARPKDQEGGLGIDATIRAAVDAAEPRIEQQFAGQPIVEASIRDTLAETYMYLGEPNLGIHQLERALSVLRHSHIGSEHPAMLESMANLGQAYREAGRLADALPLLEETLSRFKAKSGADHRDTLRAMNNLAGAYRAVGRLADAISLYEEATEVYKVTLRPNDPETLLTMNNLADAYLSAGRLVDAVPLLEKVLKGWQAELGPDNPDTLLTMANLGTAYRQAGRLTDALPLVLAARKGQEIALPPNHPDTLTTRYELACVYEGLERWSDAEPLWRDGLARRRQSEKPDSPVLADELASLGLCLWKQSKWNQAEPVLRECLTIRQKASPDDWPAFDAMSQLGEALLRQSKFADAEPLVVQGYEGMKARERAIPPIARPRLSEGAERVVRLYERWGKPERAAQWKAKLGLRDLPGQVFAPR